MKKLLRLFSLAAMIVSAVTCFPMTAGAQGRGDPPLVVKIEALRDQYKATESVSVRFSLVNNSGRAVHVLKWNTPLDGFNSDFLRVTRHDGKSATYLGRTVKRGRPTASDYVAIAPRGAATAVVDVSQAYGIYTPGDYRVEFTGRILDHGPEPIKTLMGKGELLPRSLRADPASLKVVEPRPMRESTPKATYEEAPWRVPPIAMVSLGKALYVVENQRLWEVDPATGGYELKVPPGDPNPWRVPPIAVSSLGDALYVIENQRLWRVDPATGNYALKVPARDPSPWKVPPVAMTSLGDALYVIEGQRLWRVDPVTGNYELKVPAGAQNPWRVSPIAITSLGDALYVIEGQRLWKVDPATGGYELKVPAGDPNPWRVPPIAITSLGDSLYVIENQRLWKVEPATGEYRVRIGLAGVNCNEDRMNSLFTALSNAQGYAREAYSTLASTPEADRANAQRYTTWFGTYAASRYAEVTEHFASLDSTLTNRMMTVHCDCTENYYAYVYPSRPYDIYVCSLFWSAPDTGTDSKAGTLIHEVSHFDAVAGTRDHVYGQSACQSLAQSRPADAVDNADSHEYFAENTPALAARRAARDVADALDGVRLESRLSAAKSFQVGSPVFVEFTIKNNSDKAVSLLRWHTPLEGLKGEIFKVSREGKDLPYEGPMVKRGSPGLADYVTLEPGGVLSARVDLSSGYDFSVAGNHQVELIQNNYTLVPTRKGRPLPQGSPATLVVTSNPVAFTLVPR